MAFNWDMMFQALANYGAATGGKGSWQEGVAGMYGNWLGSKRYNEMMQKFLASGGNIKMDKDATKLDMPTSMFLGAGGAPSGSDVAANRLVDAGGGVMPMTTPAASPNTPAPAPASADRMMQSSLGGYGLPDFPISPADFEGMNLAGLTPDLIHKALSGALSVEQLRQSAAAMPSQIEIRQAQAAKAYSDIANVDRTSAIKNYEYAQSQGYEGSFKEFEKDARTTYQKDYEYDVAQGYEGDFHDWMLERNRSGATRISLGEKLAEAEAKGKLKGILYLESGDFVKDLDKYMESRQAREQLVDYVPGTPEHSAAKRKVKLKRIEEMVTGEGGKIIKAEYLSNDKRFVKLTVSFEDGKRVEEFTYAVTD